MAANALGGFREPKQGRTREAWDRVLNIALEMFSEGGIDGLNVTEVCERAGISPPSLYARVDGKAGLFAAVYRHGMQRSREIEESEFAVLSRRSRSVPDQTRAVVTAAARSFRRNEPFLRAAIGYATREPEVLALGTEDAQRIVGRMVDALHAPADVAEDVARMVFAECILRTMYGAGFPEGGEPEEAFVERLSRMAIVRIDAAPPLTL